MDDLAIQPTAPLVDRTEEQIDEEIDKETTETAKVVYHPAFKKVEQRLLDEVDKLTDLTSIPESLTDKEYKIRSLANVKAADIIKSLLLEIQHAVEQVEKRGRNTEDNE